MADNFTIMLGPYEGATIEEATALMRDKAASEVFEERLSKLAPAGKDVNPSFLNEECSKLLSKALANLADGQSGYTFSNLFKNVQTTLNSFGSSGLRKLKFKAKVQADAYLEFLKELYNQQPGCNTTNISALMFGDGQSAELGNIESSVIDSALENPLEDEDDLRAASEKELEEYGATATGLDIFKAELKKAQDKIQQKIADDPLLNEIAQKADALAPTEEGQKTERLTVPLIDPKDLDATHVVLKKSKKPPLLRTKPAVAANKSKPWKALLNGTVVKVVKQNVGRGGKFHEVEVKAGEFKDSKGFMKTSELRPLVEGVLFDAKSIEQPVDMRDGGYASNVSTDWRRRKPGTPYMIVDQENPEESSYEITIRTKFANFGTKSEKVFVTEYAALGIYEIFNFYNKDFKIPINREKEEPTMTQAQMCVLLASTGFTMPSEKGFPAEWHLDTTTASARILIYVRIPVKTLDQFPKRLETFEFDKVIEGEEQPTLADGLVGSKKQVTAAQQMFIDAALLPQASIPEYISIDNYVPSKTLTCKFGHLMENIEALKEVMTYYDAAMKQDSEGRIASFPFGPVRGPLDLLKEVERLAEWKETFEQFLKTNDYDYSGEPCADSSLTSSPKEPQPEDVIEFGWNSEYQLIYVLFNGQSLKVGLNYYAARTPLKLQRINFFIHNAFDVRADSIYGQIAAEKGSGEATKTEDSPVKEGESANVSENEKIGIVTEFKDDPAKRKPWTEWVIAYVYKDAFILPSSSREDSKIKEFEFKEGPYSEAEMIKIEKDQRANPGKDKVHIETKKTTFETMDSFVQDAEKIAEKLKGLEQTYNLILNKIGIKPLADAIINCLMKEMPTVEDVMIAIGLGDVFKDTQKAIQFIGDVLSSEEVNCAMAVLTEALVLEYEKTPEQQIPGIGNYDGTVANIPGQVVAEDAATGDAAEADEQPKPVDENTGEPETQTSGVDSYKQIVAIRTSMIPKIFKGVFKDKISEYGIDFNFQNDPEIVKKLQEGLNAWVFNYTQYNEEGNPSLPELAVDGIFGPETEQVVEVFNNGPNKDPLVDPNAPKDGGVRIGGYPLEGITQLGLDSVYSALTETEAGDNPEAAADTGEGAGTEQDAIASGGPNDVLLALNSRDGKAGLKDEVKKWQSFLVSTNSFLINPLDALAMTNAPSAFAGIRQEGNKHYLYDNPDDPGNPQSFDPIANATQGEYFGWPADAPDSWPKREFRIDGIFGELTELATKNWLQGAGQIANSPDSVWYPGSDTSDQEITEGKVTNKQFKFAKSVMESLNNSAEAKKLDELLDPSQANKFRFIGPRPPAGFYCRLGQPGPGDKVYAEIIKIGRKIAASEAALTSGEPGSSAALQKLLEEQDALKIKYVNAMSSAEQEPVIGEGKDNFAGKEGTEAEQAAEMANLVVKVEAKCNDLRSELLTNLANSGVEDLTMWPGDDYIDKMADEELAAKLRDSLRRYTECYNEEITEIRKKFLENNMFGPDSYLSTITEVFPFPRTIEEAWEQFRATGRFPTNVALNPEFDGERLVKILTEDENCGILIEEFIDLLLEFVPPPTRQVLKQLIKGALDGSFAAMFKAANIPEIPGPPEVNVDTLRGLVRRTGDPDGLLKLMLETALEQMLEELVTGTVKLLVQYINEVCDRNEPRANNEGFGDLSASDIFNGRPNINVELPDLGELQDRLRALQDELNDWNLPFDVTPNGSSAPGATYSYWEVVDEMSLLFTPTQLCSLFNGEGGFVLMVTVREFLEERYEPISSMLPSEDDLREFLMVLGKYADPQICLDVRDGAFANPEPTFGEKYCPPDLIDARKLDDCLKSGLTEEQCKEMLQRERDDTINAIQDLSNLDFSLPDICPDIANMKERLPGLQSALKRILKDIADSVTMVFNADTGYFVPALMEDNKLFDLDQAIESMPNILSTLQAADTSGGAGNGEDSLASINTFALQCLKAVIPIGASVPEDGGEEEISPNQLDNLSPEGQTELAQTISDETGPSDSEKLGKDVFGKDINIDQDKEVKPEDVKQSLFDAFNSVGNNDSISILKELQNSDAQFVASSLRKSLRSRFEVKINLQESSLTLEVPRKRDNKVIYKTLNIDALIDSFTVDITESDERFIFENSRYINESVQIYAKSNFENFPPETNTVGPFDGTEPPQVTIFNKILSDAMGLENENLSYLENISLKEELSELYQQIRRNLIFKLRKEISTSKFFKKSEIDKLDLTPSSRDAKDECGIPLRIYGNDLNVASLLNPDKFIQEALDSYAEAAAKECETGPSDPPPLQQAVSEMALKMYIRTFLVNSSLNTLFMMAKFKIEDYFDDKVFLGYMMKFIKDDMLQRRIYTEGKDIAKSIIFKRSERGDEILPRLTTGYDCIKFLTEEQFADVSDQFRMILAASVKSDDLHDYDRDRFLSLITINQPKHVYPYNKAKKWLANSDGLYPRMAYATYDEVLETQIADEAKTLGFDTDSEAREYYNSSGRITYRNIANREGFFVLEPYLRVQEKVYISVDELMNDLQSTIVVDGLGLTGDELQTILDNYGKSYLTGDQLDRPVNLLIAPFLNAQYATNLIEDLENYNPEFQYESISVNDLYNWNTGLVNYVNMKEYSNFLESIFNVYQTIESSSQQLVDQQESAEAAYDDFIQGLAEVEDKGVNLSTWSTLMPGSTSPPVDGSNRIQKDDWVQKFMAAGYTSFQAQQKWTQLVNGINTLKKSFFFRIPDGFTDVTHEQLHEYYNGEIEHPTNMWHLGGTFLPAPFKNKGLGYVGTSGYYGNNWDAINDFQPVLVGANGTSYAVDYRLLYDFIDNLLYDYPYYTWTYDSSDPLLDYSEFYSNKGAVKMSWLGMWAYQAARHDHWYDKLFVDENLVLGEYGDGEPDNPLPDWLVNKKVEFDTWPVQDNWLEPAEGQDLPGLYIGEHFKQMPIRSTGLPLENNFIRDNWIIYETGYTDSLGVYGDRVLALLEDNNWIKNEILADGTAYAIEQMHLIMRLLFQYREFAKLEEEQQQSAEYLENIKSMVDAQMALPNKMKTVVESSLDSLISKGYFDGVNWGLRLSYIAMSYNLPDVYKDRAKEEYDNSDIQYLEGMGGLTNISGAPQHKIEVHKDGGFYFYYTIPIIEKEISITEKFKTENEGDVSLSDSSIYSLFTSKQAMVEDPDMSYIEDFYFKHVHQTLVDQIKASEEYNSLFDYALPMRRYVTLNSINIMMTMTKIGPGPLMYISTRDILQSIISSAINGSGPEGFEFDDPQLTALGGNAGMFSDAFNSKNFEPKKMNLGAMILKLFLETPFKILKGITEAFDPNISIIDKIMKVLKTIIELLPTKADPCIVEPVFIGYIGDYLSENNLPEGYGLPADLLQELREQAQTDMDRKLRKIKNTLKDVLDNMPVPLISVAMLPSMLPYGCGFPPPPLGPGIGPPLTPFGVAYLVLGLYRDIDFGKMNDISQRSEKDDLPDDIEILCKEKHEAYQRLVAQGAFDFPPSDDDD